MAGTFLGTGMKFPPQIDPTTGRFATVSDAQSVKESVYLILMTTRSERFMRPDFGSELLSYTFMDLGSTSVAMLTHTLTETLLKQEPRIGEINITTEERERKGVLFINVDYTIRRTNVRDNLVFPFYLNPAEEEEAGIDYYEPEDVDDV